MKQTNKQKSTGSITLGFIYIVRPFVDRASQRPYDIAHLAYGLRDLLVEIFAWFFLSTTKTTKRIDERSMVRSELLHLVNQ